MSVSKKNCRCCSKETSGFQPNILIEKWGIRGWENGGRNLYNLRPTIDKNAEILKRTSGRGFSINNSECIFNFDNSKREEILTDALEQYADWYTHSFISKNGDIKLEKGYAVLCDKCQNRVIAKWMDNVMSHKMTSLVNEIDFYDMIHEKIKDRLDSYSVEMYNEYKEDVTECLPKSAKRIDDISNSIYHESFYDLDIALLNTISETAKRGQLTGKEVYVNKSNMIKILRLNPKQFECFDFEYKKLSRSYEYNISETIDKFLRNNKKG